MDSSLLQSIKGQDLEGVLFPMVQSVALETSLLAQKSLLLLPFIVRSHLHDMLMVSDLSAIDKRFPLAELNKVEKPVAENKDAGETDEEDEDGDGDDNQVDDDGSSGEEGSDDDGLDSESDADSDGESDEDDDDEDDDDEDDDDEDDDDEEEEEEEGQPPSKKKK